MCKFVRLFSGRIFAELSNIFALVLLWLGLMVKLDPAINTTLTMLLIIVVLAILAATLSRIFYIDDFKLFDLLAYFFTNLLNSIALGIAVVSLFTIQNNQLHFTLGIITWGLAEFLDTFVYLRRANNAQRVARQTRRLPRAEANILLRSSRFATALGFAGVFKATVLGFIVLFNLVTNWPNPKSPPGITHIILTILLVFFLLTLLISVRRRRSEFSVENTLFRRC